MPVHLIEVAETGSTNDDLARLARQGASSGTAYWTRRQHAGRGRHGKSWDDLGGEQIFLSLLHRFHAPAHRLSALTLDIGVATAQLLQRWGITTHLRWPNDIFIGQHKVAGILCELIEDRTIVVGVGLNVRLPEHHHQPRAAALFDTPPPNALTLGERAHHLAHSLHEACRAYDQRQGPDTDAWLAASDMIGKKVLHETGQGVVQGLSPDGALLIQWAGDPQPRRFWAGGLRVENEDG